MKVNTRKVIVLVLESSMKWLACWLAYRRLYQLYIKLRVEFVNIVT